MVRARLVKARELQDAPMPVSRSRILIVDDDPAIRQALSLRLDNAGFDVRAVSNGEDALQECARACPEVLILDVRMPGPDGYEVCERIREEIENPITIVFLTGATHAGTTSSLEQMVIRSGGDHYVAKPYDPELIVGLLNRITGRPGVAGPASGTFINTETRR